MLKEKKIFFKSESERNLWVKLNAEVIRYYFHDKEREDLGDINTPFSYMWISNNQLTYDEHECDAPRFSFEELLTLDFSDLIKISRKQNQDFPMKTFPEYFESEE
jgi:hypothetical protein